MYKTSKDYEKLWELGMNSKIIAIYEEVKTKGFCFITPSYNNVLIYSFGQELGRFQKEVDFIDCCKRYNLEFIDPDPPKKFCKTCRWWGDNDSNEVYKHSPEDGEADCHCENLPMRNFATKTSPDFGCIFHEESEER